MSASSSRARAPGPRVVRPDREKAPSRDAAAWWFAVALGALGLGGGYFVGTRVFDPGPRDEATGEENGVRSAGISPGARAAAQGDVRDDADGGTVAAPSVEPSVEPSAEPTAAPTAPRVPVRIVSSVLQSCGDGEELTIPGPRCEPTPAVEVALRRQLASLGQCDAALAGARTPNATLSLGLRVDFARRRVTPLPGRSSSVSNPLAYVACARTATEGLDDLWREHPTRVRYLYFFSVRFGPLEAGGNEVPTTAAPTASPSAAPSVLSAAPATRVTPPAAPTASGASASASATPGASASASPASTASPSAAASGYPVAMLVRPEPAQVAWVRAVLRDAPRTGVIVGRVPSGETVTVLARSGAWWRVRWNTLEGWTYGEAIGR